MLLRLVNIFVGSLGGFAGYARKIPKRSFMGFTS